MIQFNQNTPFAQLLGLIQVVRNYQKTFFASKGSDKEALANAKASEKSLDAMIQEFQSRIESMPADDGCIETYTGILFNPFKPVLEDISIYDIAHALSIEPRFGGHTRQTITVGQHSCHVASVLHIHGPEVKLAALMHDASEAYLKDIPKPIKPVLAEYQVAEYNLMDAIWNRFGIKCHWKDYRIKAADSDNFNFEYDHYKHSEKGSVWDPKQTEERFLKEFFYLQDQINNPGNYGQNTSH